MKRVFRNVLFIALLTLALSSVALAANDDLPDRLTPREVPAHIAAQQLDAPATVSNLDASVLETSLFAATGTEQVIIRLTQESIAEARGQGKALGLAKKAVDDQQVDFLARVQAVDPNAKVIARVQIVLNAVFVEVDAAALPQLAADPAVSRIAPVANYELDLSETVPYIGASAVQAMGYDGSGVRVAVLDSGVDYYHEDLFGAGAAAYAADNQNIVEPGTFPTAKVVGGFDFVGDVWPAGPLAPDPDPLDKPTFGDGHGTHVSDIIAGMNGVAPGASLYGVKVCSSVSSSCSGVALINGMEFAVDPDGDGDPADHVDIINMSLGATYGQPFDDDLSQAVNAATTLGVLTVASAGNSADKAYVTGTPSSAATALSVAQTHVPSAGLQFITVNAVDYPAVFQSWSAPLVSTIGPVPVQYGAAFGSANGCSTDATGESEAPADRPYPAGTFSGDIVLVDRGGCTFTAKIRNIEFGGGALGIIGLVAPGAPFAGGFGGGTAPTIPGYMISQADANAIKAALPTTGLADPANVLPLVGQMVGSSSRGPQHESTNLLKPEIGAPGASVSAVAGTGTGTSAFGGTSGAAPMVSGSAALLLQASPHLSPLEAKAVLMNNGETNIDTDPFTGLAPITRIGGGEVRVDRAVGAPAAAWDANGTQGGLSFGFVDVHKDTVVLQKTVRVRNYSSSDITYNITPTFRYANDQASGAVQVQAPSSIKVKAGSDKTFTVKLKINGNLLPNNAMNSGSQGANPAALTLNEYDGYLILDDGSHPIHMPWHVLPRKAANVVGRKVLNFDAGVDVVDLTNNGVGTAQIDSYSLLATSPNMPEGAAGLQSPTPDIRGVGINTFPVPAGFCSGQQSFIWAFAVNTWERQQHLLPVSHQFWLDTNQDGTSDYVVLNRDLTFSGVSDGRQVSWAFNLATGSASAFFFAEHSMNTGNTVMYICGEQIGLTGTDMLNTNVDMFVVAQDFYYGGPGDFVGGLTVTPLGERYFGIPGDIPGMSEDILTVIDFGLFPGNTDEVGIMLVTNGDRGSGVRGGATKATEAYLLRAP